MEQAITRNTDFIVDDDPRRKTAGAPSRRAFISNALLGAAGLVAWRSSGVADAYAGRTVPTIGDAPQLFVDLDLIETVHNVQRVFHSAQKHPLNPVLRRVKPWEHDRGTWGSVIYDDEEKLFKAWYGGTSGRKKEFRPGDRVDCSVLCYATSKDGIHWDRPSLRMHEVMDTRDNNVVINDDHHNGMDHWEAVLKDPLETESRRRYKALGWSSNDWDGPLSGIYTMTSPDGLHWTHTPEPVFRYHPRPGKNDLGPVGDAHGLLIDTLRKRYIAYLRSLPNRSLSISSDFVSWTAPALCLRAQPGEEVNALYNHTGFVYGDRYLGLLTHFVRDPRNPLLTVRLLTSCDGETWQRPDTGSPLIDVGRVGEWDRFTNLITGGPPIRVGNRLYLYYRGLANRHKPYDGKDEAPRRGGGLGLATLRVDGFASMQASYDDGHLTTKLLRVRGSRLQVNAKADNGRVWAEVLDEQGKPLAGLGREQCLPVTMDQIEAPVHWQGDPSMPKLGERPVRLRFFLENAALYSFRVVGRNG